MVKLDLQIYVTGSARVTPVSSVLPSATMVKIEVESSIKKPASQRTSSTSVVWCSQSFYALAIIWRRSQLFGGTHCKVAAAGMYLLFKIIRISWVITHHIDCSLQVFM